MQSKVQKYYDTLFHAKTTCNKKCERCKVALEIAEARNHVVLMADVIWTNDKGNVTAIDTHALLGEDDNL
jgi:hypothetical protein